MNAITNFETNYHSRKFILLLKEIIAPHTSPIFSSPLRLFALPASSSSPPLFSGKGAGGEGRGEGGGEGRGLGEERDGRGENYPTCTKVKVTTAASPINTFIDNKI